MVKCLTKKRIYTSYITDPHNSVSKKMDGGKSRKRHYRRKGKKTRKHKKKKTRKHKKNKKRKTRKHK